MCWHGDYTIGFMHSFEDWWQQDLSHYGALEHRHVATVFSCVHAHSCLCAFALAHVREYSLALAYSHVHLNFG